MSPKSVVPRTLANQDVDDAIAYYLKEGAPQAALGFVDALEDAYRILGRNPSIGTPRYAIELDIPGLRTWALSRFPYVICYAEREDSIDVWRVLHGHRDIPALVEDPDPE